MSGKQQERGSRLGMRNEAILKRFAQLSNMRYKGKTKMYTNDTIFAMLSEEFYLSERTINDILFRTKNEKERY